MQVEASKEIKTNQNQLQIINSHKYAESRQKRQELEDSKNKDQKQVNSLKYLRALGTHLKNFYDSQQAPAGTPDSY